MLRIAAIAFVSAFTLTACDNVANGTADATGFVAKTAVKGVYGAGKLVYRGGRYIVVGPDGEPVEE
ncbi:hypothetical protein PARPLA_01467 [Rhodobacteraceae bacterium THAF1]|uniref:hypothetical protein n=1 Tax=Palleronia sp. THAF1 TaxID=2587842 RepID=UPI000F3E4BDF|nr:hypothetical protein [Palleronia sp. THAF1]QFU07623.1 hypothetical protein FIU81_02920 [Palleronia sp. THAF1]VDC22805.1 hypothetical protein PARPLA_01467 [Rhodobacteraceae bacterium THAF1]